MNEEITKNSSNVETSAEELHYKVKTQSDIIVKTPLVDALRSYFQVVETEQGLGVV